MSDPTRTESQSDPRPAVAPAVSHFLRLTGELTTLLARENTLLEQRRPRDLPASAGEKARLTAEYHRALAALRAGEAQLLGAKDSAIRTRIRQATEAFREELARHARLVVRFKAVTEGLVKTISVEAHKQKNPVRRYGSNARMSYRSRPHSLSLDSTI